MAIANTVKPRTIKSSGFDAQVRKAVTPRDVTAIGATLADAFFADPVSAWLIPDPERRRRSLPGLFELYAKAFVRHGESYAARRTAGAALWLPPGKPLVEEAEEASFAHDLEEQAGADAGRLFELLELFDRHHPDGDYYTLQLLGVRPAWQGRGIGSALMQPVLAHCDADGVPAYLEATSDRNIPLYERHGFRAIGEIAVPDGPSLTRMWREPASG